QVRALDGDLERELARAGRQKDLEPVDGVASGGASVPVAAARPSSIASEVAPSRWSSGSGSVVRGRVWPHVIASTTAGTSNSVDRTHLS
ncbi:MAG TPA: hypothetical protein VM261_20935, partial [Kofleriaceae bacterium]|nr:hypothetical protein [Kofleriaceae bacterium]